ncbi:hypothetical protein BDP27DRAFT_274260 [Rhodocollybia butyracea]|uniref:Uncharacterized protein n=1 Tax=Rhodocollybia butyracea TaxID=206335 RepID=A0A9P5PFZ5_9AGAR|nr:hypothetical protein BDP27DRAFT_274260 [Rhodocollybia butyracea]
MPSSLSQIRSRRSSRVDQGLGRMRGGRAYVRRLRMRPVFSFGVENTIPSLPILKKKREERRSQVRPFADQCSVSWFNHEGISCLFNHPNSGRHLNGVALQKRYSSSAIFTSMPLRDTYASVMTAGLYALRCFSLALTVTFILNSTFQNFMAPSGEHRMFLSWYQLASIAILALNPRDEWVRNVIITFLQQFIRNL